MYLSSIKSCPRDSAFCFAHPATRRHFYSTRMGNSTISQPRRWSCAAVQCAVNTSTSRRILVCFAITSNVDVSSRLLSPLGNRTIPPQCDRLPPTVLRPDSLQHHHLAIVLNLQHYHRHDGRARLSAIPLLFDSTYLWLMVDESEPTLLLPHVGYTGPESRPSSRGSYIYPRDSDAFLPCALAFLFCVRCAGPLRRRKLQSHGRRRSSPSPRLSPQNSPLCAFSCVECRQHPDIHSCADGHCPSP